MCLGKMDVVMTLLYGSILKVNQAIYLPRIIGWCIQLTWMPLFSNPKNFEIHGGTFIDASVGQRDMKGCYQRD